MGHPTITRRIALAIVIVLVLAGILVTFAGLHPIRALVVAAILPFILYVPGRFLAWGLLPEVAGEERITVTVLCSIATVTTTMLLLERVQTPVSETGGVVAVVVANIVSACVGVLASHRRR